MEATTADLAEEIKRSIKTCGLLQIWGNHVFSPGDLIYSVTDAAAQGEVLRVHLQLPLDGSKEVVEIEQPAKAKVGKAGLRVQKAARITAFGREWKPDGSKDAALVMQ